MTRERGMEARALRVGYDKLNQETGWEPQDELGAL